MESIKQVKDGVLLEVRVKTNSSQTIIYRKEDGLILELQNPPEDNKANIEAIKYLKKMFGCNVSIIHGLKSKNKTFLMKCTEIQAKSKIKQASAYPHTLALL